MDLVNSLIFTDKGWRHWNKPADWRWDALYVVLINPGTHEQKKTIIQTLKLFILISYSDKFILLSLYIMYM